MSHYITANFCDAAGICHGMRTVAIDRDASGRLLDDDLILLPEVRRTDADGARSYGLRGPGGWSYLVDVADLRALGVEPEALD